MNRGGFSWKRLLGISAAKSRISRAIGIPLTKSGRQRKIGSLLMGGGRRGGGGCGVVMLVILLLAWKGCTSLMHESKNPATSQPLESKSSAASQTPTNQSAGDTKELPKAEKNQEQPPTIKPEKKPITPLPEESRILSTLEGVGFPITVLSTDQFELLNETGMETPIPVGSVIKIEKRGVKGSLTMQIKGAMFVGNELRLLGKVKLR